MLFTESNRSSHFGFIRPSHSMRFNPVLLTAVCAMLSLPASAQNLAPSSVHALSNDWRSVQALPAQTRIRITGDRKKKICFVDSVTEDHLTCSPTLAQSSAHYEYSREEVKEIKLTNRSRSTASGALLGAGIGAGTGALIGLAANSGNKGGLCCSNGQAAGLVASIGGAAGALAGAAVGHGTDIFAGPVVYRRP